MKRFTLRKLSIPLLLACVLVVFGAGVPLFAQAPPPPAPAGPPPGPQGAAPSAPLLSPDQLDDLVAPIALYPDPLLSQVLVAATYPVEVVEAQQWLQQNRGLSGSALVDAARQQNWDPSIQALVAVPDALSQLSQNIQWTTSLGNAFLAQQADVMSAVQRMRARAQANGKLNSTPQETVTTEAQNGQSAIQIMPANPQVVYVPYYDPAYIWGPPIYGYYPPLYYPSFGFGFYPGINIGLYFGGWGGWGWGGWGWGWGPNWFGHSIFVNNGFFGRYGFGGYGGRFGTSVWAHNPAHRLGVAYPNRQLAGRFQAASNAGRMGSARFGGSNSMARSFAGSRYQSARGTQAFSGRSQGFSGSRTFGSGAYQGRSSQPARSFGTNRSFSGGSARSYSGGGSARSYSGGSARSYSGGGNARSYSGGGSAHSFSSGGTRSFGGGHSFGGGGGSHGGGHGGGRR